MNAKMTHLQLSLAVSVSLFVCGCFHDYVKDGDYAAATGDWKKSVEAYGKALKEDPSNKEIQDRYTRSKQRAIEQAMAIAKRCKAEADYVCAGSESAYVLKLEPIHAEAASIKKEAKSKVCVMLVDKAKQDSDGGKYIDAAKKIAFIRKKCENAEVLAKANDVATEMAEPAVEYVDYMVKQEPPSDLMQRLKQYEEWLALLYVVIMFKSDRYSLVSLVRSRRDQTKAEINRRRKERIAKKKEEQRRVREEMKKSLEDMHRTVAFLGVVANVHKTGGESWDGIGKAVPKDLKHMIEKAIVGANPYAGVAALLTSDVILSAVEPPDIHGVFEIVVGGCRVGRANLPKIQDSYTPQWRNIVIRNVDINNAYIRVSLFDRDIDEDDSMGVFEISSSSLKKAAEAGKVYPVSVMDQTGGQVLFALITVK